MRITFNTQRLQSRVLVRTEPPLNLLTRTLCPLLSLLVSELFPRALPFQCTSEVHASKGLFLWESVLFFDLHQFPVKLVFLLPAHYFSERSHRGVGLLSAKTRRKPADEAAREDVCFYLCLERKDFCRLEMGTTEKPPSLDFSFDFSPVGFQGINLPVQTGDLLLEV